MMCRFRNKLRRFPISKCVVRISKCVAKILKCIVKISEFVVNSKCVSKNLKCVVYNLTWPNQPSSGTMIILHWYVIFMLHVV